MAAATCTLKRNSSWLAGGSGENNATIRQKTDFPLPEFRNSEVSWKKEKDLAMKREVLASDLESTAPSQEEQKDIDQHKPPCVIMNCEDSEESEDEEGISYEELKRRKGYKLFLKYLNGTAKSCN